MLELEARPCNSRQQGARTILKQVRGPTIPLRCLVLNALASSPNFPPLRRLQDGANKYKCDRCKRCERCGFLHGMIGTRQPNENAPFH